MLVLTTLLLPLWTCITYIHNKLSIKTILFDIVDFWCQLEVIRFVKTLSKRRMLVLFMKISACWLLHRLIKFNKIWWEKRPAKPWPNLRTSFCRRDLKNTQPHLKWVYSMCSKSFLEIREYRFFWLFFPFFSFFLCVCKVSNKAFLPPLSTRLLRLVVAIPLVCWLYKCACVCVPLYVHVKMCR